MPPSTTASGTAFDHSMFALVIGPKAHSARPMMARDLGPFWRGRGYEPVEGAVARLSWRRRWYGGDGEAPDHLDEDFEAP